MKHKWITLALLVTAQLMVVLDAAIVNVALPSIEKELNFSQSALQWVVTSYAITFGGFMLLGGRAADLFGRRKILVAGMFGFALASLLIGFSQNSSMMIVFRTLQGLAAAFMPPAALSILLATFTEGEGRNRALSFWAAAGSAGAAIGVVLGGVLTEFFGWQWNFFINVPIGIVVIFGLLKYVPAHFKEEKVKQLDIRGAALITSGLMLLVFVLAQLPNWGILNTYTILLFSLSIALLAGFVYNEQKATRPLVPFSVFRIRNITGANIVMILAFSGMFSMFFFTSLFIQNVLNHSPLMTGIRFLPVPLLIFTSTQIAPTLIKKFGYKTLIVLGTSLAAIGMSYLSTITASSTYLTGVLPGLTLIASGIGMTFVSVTIAATSGVPSSEAGLASGLITTSQRIGGATGLAILSLVASSTTNLALTHNVGETAALVQGYSTAYLAASGLMSLALIVTIFVIRDKR